MTRSEAVEILEKDQSDLEAVLVRAYGEASITSWEVRPSSGGCTISGGRKLFSEMELAGAFDLADAYQTFRDTVGDDADVSPITTDVDGVERWRYTGRSPLLAMGGARVEDGVMTVTVLGLCFSDEE